MTMWKRIPKYDDYEISNKGKIRRAIKGYNKPAKFVLKWDIGRDGYAQVTLSKKGQLFRTKIHRLVLLTFFGPCPKNMECNHKDGNKLNNCIENLEWVTKKEQVKHAIENGLRHYVGEKGINSKLKEGEVWLIRKIINSDYYKKQGYTHTRTLSLKKVAKMFKMSESTIKHIKHNRNWSI